MCLSSSSSARIVRSARFGCLSSRLISTSRTFTIPTSQSVPIDTLSASSPKRSRFDPAAPGPANPIDRVSWDRYEQAWSNHSRRRMGFYAAGLVVGMLGFAGVVATTPEQSPNANANAAQCDGPAGLDPSSQIVLATRDGAERIETGISSVPYMPATLAIPRDTAAAATSTSAETDDYVLVGQGVRTVSFLGIQVYVVALYVRQSHLGRLRAALSKTAAATPQCSAETALETALVDGDLSYDIWNSILRLGDDSVEVDSLFRVVPTRSTDMAHMRDGWVNGVRAVTNELRAIRKTALAATVAANKELADEPSIALAERHSRPLVRDSADLESESFAAAIRSFQSIFGGRGKVAYGSALWLRRVGRDGSLDIFSEQLNDQDESGKKTSPKLKLVDGSTDTKNTYLGSVADERVARLIWLRYLAGKNCSSQPARKSIVAALSR